MKELLIVVAFVAVAALIRYWNQVGQKTDWLKGKSGFSFTDPRTLIALGLVVFNLVVWSMIHWFWEVLTYTWYAWAFFNLGFWTVLYLRTVKAKD